MDYLSQEEQAKLKGKRLTDVFVDETLRQLDRILASPQFERVQQRAKDFLGFVVAKALLNSTDDIKEMTIALRVWKEDTDFNPILNNKIRVAAGDLRDRLAEYYSGEGKNDPIEIVLRKGGYVPEILERWPTIAVSPLQNWGPKADQDHFCVTIRNEIVHRLTCAGGVRATRVARFDTDDPRYRYCLRGSLECRNAFLRVNISVCDRQAARIVFSGALEAGRDDILKLSRDVAEAVLDALKSEPGNPNLAVTNEPAEGFEALHLYQQGRLHLRRRTAPDIRKAIDFFEKAVAANGQYARAFSGLADCHLLLSWYALSTPDRAWFETGKAHALRALELNPGLPEVHTSLAYAKLLCDFDWSGAEKEFERAILIQNRYAPAHHWYANLLVMQGRFTEAEEEMKRAFHLDPGSSVIRKTVGDPFYYSRRYNEAIDSYTAALKIDPNFWMAHLFLGLAYEHTGEFARAMQEFERVTVHAGVSSIVQGAIGHLYAITGRETEALALIERLREQSGAPYVAPHTLAVIYAGLGETDQAFDWLEASYENRIELLAWIKVDPRFDPLRSDPRFDEFLKKIGLSSGNAVAPGSRPDFS